MIPASLQAAATFLQTQVAQNTPLTSAPQAQVTAMQLNADNLITAADLALLAAAGQLDTFTAPVGAIPIIQGVVALAQAAQNQRDIALFAGIVGRVALNLAQLP
jgi:hypothetical protein